MFTDARPAHFAPASEEQKRAWWRRRQQVPKRCFRCCFPRQRLLPTAPLRDVAHDPAAPAPLLAPSRGLFTVLAVRVLRLPKHELNARFSSDRLPSRVADV